MIIKEEVSSSSTEYRPFSSSKLTAVPVRPLSSGFATSPLMDHAPAKQRRLLRSVPYQHGDSSVPLALSSLQSSKAILSLDVDVTARSKELRCDGRMPVSGSVLERRAPILCLKIDVTASFNELLRDGRMPSNAARWSGVSPSSV